MSNRIIALCIGIFLWSSNNALAQLQVLPHGYLNYSIQHNTNARTAADSSILKLPFWDDFSTSKYFPDTAKWVNSENVSVMPGAGINPPTINVASFDGVDGFGNPYSSNGKAIGEGDSLVSKFIDLTNITDPGSIYLSFFVQREGNGELPDSEDKISLLFKDKNNEWVTVWDTTGTELTNSDEFVFKIVPVTSEDFHHEFFQFKFESTGRLSGAYDTWNVDYVYLNDGRNPNDKAIKDRAFGSYPTSIFKEYTAIPFDQFDSDPGQYLDSSSIHINNLNEVLQALKYYGVLKSGGSDDVIDSIRNKKVFNLDAFSSIAIGSDVVNGDVFSGLGDSLYLETEFVLISNDSLIDGVIDPRVNDTVRAPVVIHEDLAYDDGSSEFSVALNSNGAKIAYEFNTPISDEITGIKMYLPKFSGTQEGSSLILYVWKELSEDSQLYRQEAVPIKASAINEFGTYELLKPVTVEGTFYIGFEQTVDDFFSVGLDKNTNTGDKIFFNVDGSWEPATGLKGSLMMRPVFGDAESVVTSVDPLKEDRINVFPNPFRSTLNIKGDVEQVQIYNLQGRKVFEKAFSPSLLMQIDGSQLPSGIYILRIFKGGTTYERKVIKK